MNWLENIADRLLQVALFVLAPGTMLASLGGLPIWVSPVLGVSTVVSAAIAGLIYFYLGVRALER